MFKNIFTLLLCSFVAESTKDIYEYVPSVGLYFKIHRFPVNWQEARSRCHLENGILASPENKNMLTAIMKIMQDDKEVHIIHTGIHATYSKGDYTTITGTPLSELDVKWQIDEPNNLHNAEDCLAMDYSGKFADIKCTNDYPFICHKLPEKINSRSCSYSQDVHSEYVLHNETGSCYKFHKVGRSWPDAFKTCQAEDAYLAIINSEKESQFIKELFAQNPHSTIPGNINKDAASVGFSKWDNTEEWFTIHGQSFSEAGFATFNAGEPNNVGNNEKCGSVWRTGLLNDHNCGTILAFICEKPVDFQVDSRNSDNI